MRVLVSTVGSRKSGNRSAPMCPTIKNREHLLSVYNLLKTATHKSEMPSRRQDATKQLANNRENVLKFSLRNDHLSPMIYCSEGNLKTLKVPSCLYL